MSSGQSKTSMGSTASALLAQGSLYSQLAWVELTVEKRRLMGMLLLLLVGACLLTSLLVSLTILLLLASWDTPYRISALVAAAVVYCAGFTILCLRFNALARKGDQAFSDTREELAEDLELIRKRFEQ